MKKPTTACPTCGREVSAALASLRPDAETLTCPGRGAQPRPPGQMVSNDGGMARGLMQFITSTFDQWHPVGLLDTAARPDGFRAGGILPPFNDAKQVES